MNIAVQYIPKPPQPLSDFCRAYESLVGEIHYLEDKDAAIKERIQSFNELKHWTIPIIHNDNSKLKAFDEWRKEYEGIINVSIQTIVDKEYINEPIYQSITRLLTN